MKGSGQRTTVNGYGNRKDRISLHSSSPKEFDIKSENYHNCLFKPENVLSKLPTLFS